jgi:hypothetical protein
MHILRFASKGIETERKNRLIVNRKFLEEPGYKYEYKLLLRDTFDELEEKIVSGFIEWVKNIKKSEEDRKEIEEWCKENKERLPDFEKMENWQRAEELYLVQDKFKDIYREYVKKAGVDDESKLAPRRMVGEVRHVSPKEGTPLTSEEMTKKKPSEVLDYVLDPKNYEVEKKKRDDFRDATSALRATFKEDVKKRPKEYLECDLTKLKELTASFLASLFYGLNDSIRDGSFEKDGWERLIEFASDVVSEKHQDESYRDCFSAIVDVLQGAFSERDNAVELDKSIAKQYWSILVSLVHFPIGDMNRFGKEWDKKDPMQIRCNIVAGEALGMTVSLGIACKKKFEDYWTKELKGEMRKCWEFALTEIKEPGVNCVFGVNFSRIYWLDNEWVQEEIESIFCEELWDEIWGTYVSWSRPSPDGFELLVEKGEYCRAVELLGSGYKYKYEFQKKTDEGLVEHLMTGFFNGWIGLEDSVLVKFFEVATAKLRGKAARFLTTGFKSVNKEGGEEEGSNEDEGILGETA